MVIATLVLLAIGLLVPIVRAFVRTLDATLEAERQLPVKRGADLNKRA
jgi:hypothetical protein